MTTATMEMLTTATTTTMTPGTGNSVASVASTAVASSSGGSGGYGVGGLEDTMRHPAASMDYSNLSGVGPLIEELDGVNVTTVSQHSNDSMERIAGGISQQPGGGGGAPVHVSGHHQKGHSRGSSAPLAYDRITTKIACTKELIRKEQEARDANVNEYLKLAANADKQQLARIKAVFEKKNQKSANTISQLQKKLESYNKRYKDLQQTQQKQQQQQPREMLRDVGQGLRNVGGNIRHGVTGLSATVISKPRKFAHLIRNKFGSADNINQLTATWYTGTGGAGADGELSGMDMSGTDGQQTSTPSGRRQGSAQPQPGGTTGGQRQQSAAGGKYSEHDSECSSVTSDSIPLGSDKHHRLSCSQRCVHYKALGEVRDEQQKQKERLERLELLQKDVSELSMSLENERYRADRLEEQINDLSELHQNERENLKQAIADLEEKVQYQSDERLRDVNEILENCQTRIAKMEQLSQQQYVTVEGIYNSNARAVVVKLINVVLTVLQVILLLVATAAGIIVPFLKTRFRVLTTLVCTIMLFVIVRQWPDVRDTGVHLLRILRSQVVSDDAA
ncbi:transmembrane and coiled-coil domains protein 2 isoform X2 [Anopheles bellator]|uniref:transmembrane and coiled-coil domains protein 2 isoform X2 n=1 Tax=Anopheles bellator TaxID=139047 RepID=UPI0026489A40|nr:transmembrane and coiled-coil domains protein 2 isoform X2 [Anopheles bellator]